MAKKIGLRIATKGDSVTSRREMLLDTSKKQLKYRKIINAKIFIPSLPIGTSWKKVIRIYFNEDRSALPFAPAYDYRVETGYNGRWSKPKLLPRQGYEPSLYDFPFYYRNELVTDDYFEVELTIANVNSGPFVGLLYPPQVATLRLYVMFDESEYV